MELSTILDPLKLSESTSFESGEEIDPKAFSKEWSQQHPEPNSRWFGKYGDEADLRLSSAGNGKYLVYDHDGTSPMFTLGPTMPVEHGGDSDRPPSKVYRYQGRAFDVEYYHDGSVCMVREIDS